MIVQVRGVLYPSVAATAEALGVSRDAVYSALNRGNMERLGLGTTQKHEVVVEGITFPSMSFASEALGFSRSYLRTALLSGSDRVKEKVQRAARKYKLNLNKGDLPL
jgi:DNA-binding FadR family transcriptional regulator